MLFAFQLHESRSDAYMTAILVEGGGAYTAEQLEAMPLSAELIREAMEIEAALKEQGKLVGLKQGWVEAGRIASVDVTVQAPAPLPGPLANQACGLAGLLCVIVAGWTTANPTIYRAGLAFQAIMPKVSRFKVTLATGMLATLAGMFPALAMKLLGFVALYGLVLMPMGAVIFVDFWLFGRMRLLGLADSFAARRGIGFNVAAGVAWFATFAICLALVRWDPEIGGIRPFQIYFVSLPGWFVAALLYIGVSVVMQYELHREPVFRLACQVISWTALGGVVVPGVAYLGGLASLEQVQGIMVTATIAWFVATPIWMGRPVEEE